MVTSIGNPKKRFTVCESRALTAGNNYGQLSGRRVISELADFSGLILHPANRDDLRMILGVHRSVCQLYDSLMSNGWQYFISAFSVTRYK